MCLVPEDFQNAPVADQNYALLSGNATHDIEKEELMRKSWQPGFHSENLHRQDWEYFNSENFVAETVHDDFKFSARQTWFSTLGAHISEPLLLENLVEVFGFGGLSTDNTDEYKQTWQYELYHHSNSAVLEFHNYKGLPRFSFRGKKDALEEGLEVLNYLVRRPVLLPETEADFREELSDTFMLRKLDARILRHYNQAWYFNEDEADSIREKKVKGWKAEQPHEVDAKTTDMTTGLPEIGINFNTQISAHLLLHRLLLLFGPYFISSTARTWSINLKHEAGCWFNISNTSGMLNIAYAGEETHEDRVRDLIRYIISDTVTTPYDGLVAGRVA